MKINQSHFPFTGIAVLSFGFVLVCGFNNPGKYNTNTHFNWSNSIKSQDTIPLNNNLDDGFYDKALKESIKNFDENMANLDEQIKNLKIDMNEKVKASLDKINIEELKKQATATLQQIDWNKMQDDIKSSVKNARDEFAKIDFTKMQDDIIKMQEKLKPQDFQRQIEDAVNNAQPSIKKMQEKLKRLDEFSDALAADGLIDKKKSYTLEWKSGELYINDKVQPEAVSHKYRKYENDFNGKIKMFPDDAESF